MKHLHLDCGMGAAGDMLTAALLELVPQREAAVEKLNHLGLPGVVFTPERAEKCGIQGTHMCVTWNGEEELPGHHHHDHEHTHHHHSGVHEILHVLQHLDISDKVRQDAAAVFASIAEAESQVHGVPMEQIHFHEVGTMDAVADVVAVCYLMELLHPDKITATAVHVGSGTVRCAHGILPVPAPATALLLKGIPVYAGEISGELCTPTGAALLRHFVQEYCEMPILRPLAYGYGMGKKDFPRANCVRAVLGQTEDTGDEVLELSCNLDDMTPEAIGYAMEKLYDAGALEAYTLSAGMKKNRPGVVLCALCRPGECQAVTAALFRHTTTIGVRQQSFRRYTLSRRTEIVSTPYGEIRKKVSDGYGVTREKYEFDDLRRLAEESQLSIPEILKTID